MSRCDFMKKGFALVLTAALLALSACGTGDPGNEISRVLDIDLTGGKEVSSFDTHGGFHGDGTSCVVIRFEDDTVLEEIGSRADWKAFPLDETVRTLVYRVSDLLHDENGDPLVPEIQNGYYLLIDRHGDKSQDILNRASFNFTLALYDADTDTLYYCKLDT